MVETEGKIELEGAELMSPRGRSKERARTRRTTLIVPRNIHRNLELLCAIEGVTKNDYLVGLVRDDLAKKGYQPDRAPKASVSY